MHFTRWWNPSLPQTVSVAALLLYFEGVSSLLLLLGIPLGGSAYVFLPHVLGLSSVRLSNPSTLPVLAVFASGVAYIFAALAIVNGKRLGWKIGTGVAIGAVVIPLLAGGLGLVLGSTYVISYVFGIALVALLLHPMTREYQKIWLE